MDSAPMEVWRWTCVTPHPELNTVRDGVGESVPVRTESSPSAARSDPARLGGDLSRKSPSRSFYLLPRDPSTAKSRNPAPAREDPMLHSRYVSPNGNRRSTIFEQRPVKLWRTTAHGSNLAPNRLISRTSRVSCAAGRRPGLPSARGAAMVKPAAASHRESPQIPV